MSSVEESSPDLTAKILSLPKITQVPYSCSPSLLSIWLPSLSVSLFSLRIPLSLQVCAFWTEINFSASCLHKRLVFSHPDSSLTFYELLNSTQCYAHWVGAPKLIITQPWCLFHCVCCTTKSVYACCSVNTCEVKCVQARWSDGRSIILLAD